MKLTPKQKAEQLVRKMYAIHSDTASDITLFVSKQCAIEAVNEILMAIQDLPLDDVNWDYWHEVIQEIKTYGGNK
jgi:hypothetical protein